MMNESNRELLDELAQVRQRVIELERALREKESIASDFAERNRVEDELAASRAILEATAESLPFDFWAIGPDGRYIIQNSASKSHWGDAIGKRPEDVADTPENLSVWLDNNRRLCR